MAGPKDGGPAFPVAPALPMSSGKQRTGESGMTLRDWFAGQALTGLVSRTGVAPIADREFAAKMAYGIADAMLAERSK